MLKLYIANKNYSSWSMRPWVLMKQAGIAFEEVMVPFDTLEAGSHFKKTIEAINPAGRVPVLVDGEIVVHDTLAICEYLAETCPDKVLWPRDKVRRAHARSICAEMHAGFAALRNHCGMNIEADLRVQGKIILRDQPQVRADLARIVQMWSGLLEAHGGPMLFGEFGIADAYFAPVGVRIKTFGLPVPAGVTAYIERVQQLPGVKAWIDEALVEKRFVVVDEPYRIES
ncbi:MULTISPECIES: glutathione S-transferase family protein [unclassified Variovorax]|uniref:glutathione S-transferase family protein n=1 Tax=unclassified Variovorax TaxID=663243 RepID=UPI00076C628A|nr:MULTISPECIES: glutathione S-transferase family protein [unclassified Variovorax]KWT94198.1 Glutathione S-transferase [Variovorax sp. WDL1]PNG59845.1 Glutathione S-transferase GST-6.0 [Variovorax sp. B4]PNG60364.1 Glutathione S-transferase GST-6.0 [Variovorax sp. B2]VTV13778.1 Glutathione S-transferase GST-6.0 [Variovorax sp. WDL1]